MNKIKVAKVFLWVSIALLFAMSATVLLMPYVVSVSKQSNNTALVFVGGLFWLFLFVGYTTLIVSCRFHKANSVRTSEKKRPGIICFFSNKHAVIVDILLGVFILMITVFSFTPLKSSYVMYVMVFLLLFLFNMHCIVNGEVFNALK